MRCWGLGCGIQGRLDKLGYIVGGPDGLRVECSERDVGVYDVVLREDWISWNILLANVWKGWRADPLDC